MNIIYACINTWLMENWMFMNRALTMPKGRWQRWAVDELALYRSKWYKEAKSDLTEWWIILINYHVRYHKKWAKISSYKPRKWVSFAALDLVCNYLTIINEKGSRKRINEKIYEERERINAKMDIIVHQQTPVIVRFYSLWNDASWSSAIKSSNKKYTIKSRPVSSTFKDHSYARHDDGIIFWQQWRVKECHEIALVTIYYYTGVNKNWNAAIIKSTSSLLT